jgi:hypothetical protein
MLIAIERNEPLGIGFNEIQRAIRCSTRTIARNRKRLLNSNWIEYDSRRKFHITQKGKEACHNETLRTLLAIQSNSFLESTTRAPSKKNNLIHPKESGELGSRECTYILLSVVATLGNHNYKPTGNPEPGDIGSIDIKTGRPISMTPTNHKLGVGLSDFTKNEKEGIQSTLDRRRFVIYNEAFAYLHLPREELEQYIYELLSGDGNPILKEITISDYDFLSYHFDIDRDDPNFTTLIRDGARINEDQLTHREVINGTGKYGKYKISFYHDTYCSRDNFNGHDIGSKIVFNINNESSKSLGLSDYYKNNNFSISTWKEKRYIIADEGLRDFILICYRGLDLVWQRMDYVHHHFRLRPKYKWTKTIRKSYIDWYKLVYGIHRRIAETFLESNKPPCRYRTLDSKDFQAICDLEQNFEPKALSWLDKEIVGTYNLVQNEKYVITRLKYKIIVEPLLRVCFPSFLREVLRIR